MAYPRLDAASRRAKGRSFALFFASLGALMFGSSLARLLHAPYWVAIPVMVLPLLGIGWALVMARNVRCPSCNQSVYYRFAPTWIRPPRRPGEPNLLSCAHCYEEIDVSGGTSPPANVSLHRQ